MLGKHTTLTSGHRVSKGRTVRHGAHHRHHHHTVARTLRSAITHYATMLDLRALCVEWVEVHRMSDHEVIAAAAGLISMGHLTLSEPTKKIAWGKAVSADFKDKVIAICDDLGVEVDFLMAAMAFESAETFRSDIKNAAGSGAVGLIQFMPATATALGTSTDDLAAMTPVAQLDYVKDYFKSYKDRLKTIEDVYMAILWPAAIGKDNGFVLFAKDDPKHPKRYGQNKGLDIDKDGKVTKAEAASGVKTKLDRGRTLKFFG